MASCSSKESVNVMELPSKRFHNITLPFEKGGDMMTMDKFLKLMEEKLSENVSWVKLMVGNRIVTKHDATRSVHYFLLINSPWYVYTVDSKDQSLLYFIKTHQGEIVPLPACETNTVFDIKEKIFMSKKIPVHEQTLLYKSKKLKDEDSITIVPTRATIDLTFRLPGGRSAGRPFVDIADAKGPAKIKWSKQAPEWRVACNGLCLEGECENNNCRANGKIVIMNRGFDEFDFINDSHDCKCPLCKAFVLPKICGFNNCTWQWSGRKFSDYSKPPETIHGDLKSTGDYYERFSPDRNGTAAWLALKISCRKKQSQICVECGMEMDNMDATKKARCGHVFHDECFHSAVNNNKTCTECAASLNRTSYQAKFG